MALGWTFKFHVSLSTAHSSYWRNFLAAKYDLSAGLYLHKPLCLSIGGWLDGDVMGHSGVRQNQN
jgi:hypothetical protein